MSMRPLRPALPALAFAILCAAAFGAISQTAPAPATQASAQVQTAKPAASGAAHTNAARTGRNGAVRTATRPAWRELPPVQQQALAPLAAQWDTLSEGQKRKWIALSANFPKLPVTEQAKLHSRMTEWVSLSPQQRTVARLNYGETRQLAPDDKKAKWEAYQALPPEEKKKLAAGVSKPPSTAAAIRPVPGEKLAIVPRQRASTAAKSPRIAAAPNQVDHNTLLPQPPGQAQPGTTH